MEPANKRFCTETSSIELANRMILHILITNGYVQSGSGPSYNKKISEDKTIIVNIEQEDDCFLVCLLIDSNEFDDSIYDDDEDVIYPNDSIYIYPNGTLRPMGEYDENDIESFEAIVELRKLMKIIESALRNSTFNNRVIKIITGNGYKFFGPGTFKKDASMVNLDTIHQGIRITHNSKGADKKYETFSVLWNGTIVGDVPEGCHELAKDMRRVLFTYYIADIIHRHDYEIDIPLHLFYRESTNGVDLTLTIVDGGTKINMVITRNGVISNHQFVAHFDGTTDCKEHPDAYASALADMISANATVIQ